MSGASGVISAGTQGSDLTALPFISSSMIWHLSLILEGSEEAAPVEEADNSSVSEGGREHNLRIEGVLPTFQVSAEQSP